MLYFTLLKEKEKVVYPDENIYNEVLYSQIAKLKLKPSPCPLEVTDVNIYRVIHDGKEYRLVKHLVFIDKGTGITLYVLEC